MPNSALSPSHKSSQTHLSSLPPPSPADDPREPSPAAPRPTRGSRTPNRHISPVSSRATSPIPGLPAHRLSNHASMPHLPPSPSNVASFNAALAASGTHLSRPSSPNSIHSSSSAIFERDIEALPLPSLTLNHKPSKLSHPPHGTALDNSVPAVLDDAVEALAAMSNEPFQLDEVEIEAPAASASPAIGRQSSRPPPTTVSRSSSPSSPARDAFGQVSPPILSQLGGYTPATQSSTDSIPIRPKMASRISTGMVLPGGFPLHGAGELLTPEDEPAIEEPVPVAAIPSHLSPAKDRRRISYISYNDLLLSVPTAVTPLNDITTGTLSPDHLPGTVSPQVSMSASPPAGPEHKSSWEGTKAEAGEWEREGLGQGLEQRLEGLVSESR